MTKLTLLAALFLFSSFATAEIEEGYPANTTIKGYAKRDRLLIGGIYSVSPSQLHEVKGLRADFGTELSRSVIRLSGERSEITSPSTTARAEYGWDHMTLAVAGGYLDADNKANEATDENITSTKLIPQLAYTIGKYATVGAGLELNMLDLTERAETETTFSYNLQRPFIGAAYHTPNLEFGIAYNSEVQDLTRASRAQPASQSLSLAKTSDDDARSVYIPSETILYGRGNLSDAVSLMSSISMSRYDGNVEGSIPLFDKYHGADRLAAKVLGTYTTPQRSSLSLALEYKGGATTAVGADEAGVGYRLANTYGASVAGVLAFDRKTYIGLMAGYARGERDEDANDGTRYTSRETSTRLAGSITLKL